jgi:hypothetical protein
MKQRTALTIIALFWLLSIICGGVCGFLLYPKIYPCNQVGTVKIEYIDSTAPNKDTAQKISFVPVKVGVKKYNMPLINNAQKFDRDSLKHNEINENCIDQYSPIEDNYHCLDTNLYKFDTISVDNFRATATATVANNEILNMAIEWRNLKPELWKIKRETITVQQKQSLVKIYTGIYGGVAISNKTVASYHGGIGLDAIISDRHLIGLQGGLNSSLQMEFGVRFSEKIRLKK